jgi:dephospho-CoA kinase
MGKVLITGMSGTGKSTALAELARRGHRVVDVDDVGWSVEVPLPDGSGAEQVWREEPVAAVLAENVAGTLFVGGCASNQGSFYDRFDAVALLSAPREVLLQRLASRTTNPFGKTPAQRQRVLDDLEVAEPLLRATATAEFDTTGSLSDLVDALEALAARVDGQAVDAAD